MTQGIAVIAYAGLIGALYWLDRDRKTKTSLVLWIPIIWLALASSRSVTQWLQVVPLTDSSQSASEGSPVDAAVYTGLLFIGLVVLFTRRKRVTRLLFANGPIVFFFFYCLVSIVWSDFPDVSFKRWTKAIGDFVMVLIVLSDLDPAAAAKRFLMRVAYVLIPLSLLFVKYYPELGKVYGKWDYKASYTGVTTNKNALGALCLLFGLACVWCAINAWKNREGLRHIQPLIAYGVTLGIALWLFNIADSMTSFSTFLLALPLLLFSNAQSSRRRPAMIHILAVSTIAAALIAEFVLPSLLVLVNRNPTLTDRTGIWALALSLTKNPLVGSGFESFWLGPRLAKMWSNYSWGPEEAHNGYIEIYLQLGWLGIVLLGVVLVTGYRTIVAAWRRNSPTASLMLAYFVVGIIYNMTESAFFRMMAPVWVILLLALTKLPSSARQLSYVANVQWRATAEESEQEVILVRNSEVLLVPNCTELG